MSKPAYRHLAGLVVALAACSAEAPGPSTEPDAGDSGPDAQSGVDAGDGGVGSGPCDPTDGSGCSGDRRCVWLPSSDAVRCRAIDLDNALAVGATCEPRQTRCAAGATCALIQGASEARCRKTCRPSQGNRDCDALIDEHVCVELSPSSGEFGICSPITPCDPLLDDCSAGEACAFVHGGALGCAPAGTAEVRDDCSTDQPCQRGLICVNLGSEIGQKCYEPCDTGNPSSVCTTPSTRCRRLLDQTFGICADSIQCDPLNDICPPDQRCTLVAGSALTECQPAGNVPRGGDCRTMSCQRGNVCVDVDGTAGPICYEPCGAMSACSVGTCSVNLEGFGFGICR